jgi:preprotein translocase subunit SecG
MISSVLSNVPLGTADFLAQILLVLVAAFLVTGALVTYFLWRKTKRMRTTAPTSAPVSSA